MSIFEKFLPQSSLEKDPQKKYENVDLTSLIRHKNLKESYPMGDQFEILKDAFDVDWQIMEKEDEWQGKWYAIFIKDEKWYLLDGVFGDDEMTDDLVDVNPEVWLKDEVENTRVFNSKEDLIEWLEGNKSVTKNVEESILEKLK